MEDGNENHCPIYAFPLERWTASMITKIRVTWMANATPSDTMKIGLLGV